MRLLEVARDPLRQLVALVVPLVALVREDHHAYGRGVCMHQSASWELSKSLCAGGTSRHLGWYHTRSHMNPAPCPAGRPTATSALR